MKNEKKIKLEVIKNDHGIKTIEAQYKIGSNTIRTDMTLEVIAAFKDYLFLDSLRNTIDLSINRENNNDTNKTDESNESNETN